MSHVHFETPANVAGTFHFNEVSSLAPDAAAPAAANPDPPLGDAQASAPNAQALEMEATFWIQTVEYTVQVPVTRAGQGPLTIAAEPTPGGAPVPSFLIAPPAPVTAPRTIRATATQIQYAQQVFLNFNGLTWPHASVATLVPGAPVPVPASAFS